MDGIDVALIQSDGGNFVKRGPSAFTPYEQTTRQRIEAALMQARTIKDRHQRPGKLTALERELTDLHHQAIGQFLTANKLSSGEIDLIGFHGQTILHKPEDGLTIQLGDGQHLADQTGIEVIYDMRANDMEHDGQGAPLVPAYHGALFSNIAAQMKNEKAVVFANIGGISNLTYVGSDGQLIAFDSGPGNCLIDQWIHERTGLDFDEGGAIAGSGNIVDTICSHYLRHPYLSLPFPKSLDRKDFQPLIDNNVSTADGARSLARLTALILMASIDQLPTLPGLVIVCGGGTLNPVIMAELRALSQEKNIQVVTADESSFSSSAMEAEAFAYLAIRAKLGEPLTYPMTTGCSQPVSGGKSALPDGMEAIPKSA